MTGKSLRLRRLWGASGRTVVVPLDHTLSMGSVPGLDEPERVVRLARDAGANAVVLRPGTLRRLLERGDARLFDGIGVVVQLSGATTLSPTPARQALLSTVEEALRLGADGVSVQLTLGCSSEAEMLAMVGRVARSAERVGLPLLVMAYVRDDAGVTSFEPANVLHAARAAEELGADLIKVPFTTRDELREATRILRTPVVVAGGPKVQGRLLVRMVADALDGGAAGVCIGRNVFQASDPASVLAMLCAAVHRPAGVVAAASLS